MNQLACLPVNMHCHPKSIYSKVVRVQPLPWTAGLCSHPIMLKELPWTSQPCQLVVGANLITKGWVWQQAQAGHDSKQLGNWWWKYRGLTYKTRATYQTTPAPVRAHTGKKRKGQSSALTWKVVKCLITGNGIFYFDSLMAEDKKWKGP